MGRKTGFALLGILTQGPQSGYDIKKKIGQSIGNFWHESYGQLYPTLKELVENGFATMEIEHNDGKPDKKVYSITDAGKLHLKYWLENPIESLPSVRHELLLKLFFGNEVSPEISIDHVKKYQGFCNEELRKLNEIKGVIEKNCIQMPACKYWLLTLSYGLKHIKAELEWCDESLEVLQKEIK